MGNPNTERRKAKRQRKKQQELVVKINESICPKCGGYKKAFDSECDECLHEWAERNGAQCPNFD